MLKKTVSLILVLCLAVSLAACSKSTAGSANNTDANVSDSTTSALPAGGFRVGFGRANITPKSGVPMASYGNAKDRISEGIFSYLLINVLSVDDGENTLLLLTIDHSWFSDILANPIKQKITGEYGIPADHILMQGTHTHAGPEVGETSVPSMGIENDRTVKLAMEAVDDAMADLKPAEIYVGSVMTEGMNFVRRYFMDDGSLIGDNYDGTGTTIVRHETEADGEVQLMKFVRQGGEDILIVNFQAHPHLEGKTLNLSAQTPGAIRDAVEKRFDNKCIYWQGPAGNINTHSRIESENKFDRSSTGVVAYGTAMADYISTVYDSMTPVASGPIQVIHKDAVCQVNHTEDHLINIATQVDDIWTSTGNAKKAMEIGTPYGIRSVYHAGAILKKARLGTTSEIPIAAFSFGDVSAVVVPYEMFDTSGKQIKDGTPFEKTFIFGYANPGSYSYMPDEKAYGNIGYEGTMCRFARGTAEQLVGEYLGMLHEMKGE